MELCACDDGRVVSPLQHVVAAAVDKPGRHGEAGGLHLGRHPQPGPQEHRLLVRQHGPPDAAHGRQGALSQAVRDGGRGGVRRKNTSSTVGTRETGKSSRACHLHFQINTVYTYICVDVNRFIA